MRQGRIELDVWLELIEQTANEEVTWLEACELEVCTELFLEDAGSNSPFGRMSEGEW